MIRGHLRSACPMQIIEDCIGAAKNWDRLHQGQRFRKPERVMSTILRSKTLDERHHWHTVSSETPVGPKSLRLNRSAFQATVLGRSLPFQ